MRFQNPRKVRSRATVFPLAMSRFHAGMSPSGQKWKHSEGYTECTACTLWYYSHVPTKERLRSLLDQPQLVGRWSPEDRSDFRSAHYRDERICRFVRPGTRYRRPHRGIPRYFGFELEEDRHSTPWFAPAARLEGRSMSSIASWKMQNCRPMLSTVISAFDVFEHLYSPDESCIPDSAHSQARWYSNP